MISLVRKAQKQKRSILPSYVSTAQIMPINRQWLDQYVGEVTSQLMEDIDFQVINNIGLMEMVTKIADSLYHEQLDRFRQEIAAAQNQE